MGGLHWLFVNCRTDKDALSSLSCTPLVWSRCLEIFPGRPVFWWKESTIVTDEIWLLAHVSVLLHQIQSIGKGDLQEQEEGGGGSGFLTADK